MKQIYIFLTLMMFAFAMNAQYIYNDFDENQNEPFTGWPNEPTVVANPDMSGINTSAQVAEWVRTAEQWAHTKCPLDGKIDFSTGTMFEMKVHVPIECEILFKLEDKNNGNVFTEIGTTVTTVNEWVQVSFDFTDAQSGLYDQIVIFFDFTSVTDNTYYFDDVTGPEYDTGGGNEKPLLEADVQDNFEDDGWGTIPAWKFQDPEIVDLSVIVDPNDETNHVGEYNRSGGFQYTNAQFILEHRMDLTTRHMFEVKAFFPSSNDYSGELTPTLALKLQNSLMGGNAWMTQTEVKLTVEEFDTWLTLVFDFAGAADSVNYDQVVVQFGGEGHFVPGLFHFDDLYLQDPAGIETNLQSEMAVYPNPATDELYFEHEGNFDEVSIYSISGKLMQQSDVIRNSISLENLAPGLYLLQAKAEDGKEYRAKFLVK